MNRTLDVLAARFKPLAMELLARCIEMGLMVMIVNTLRTDAEQAVAVASGHSQVAHSKHQDGLAIDICPYDIYQLHGSDKLRWDASDPAWKVIGAIGEKLGLRWGGRFHPLDHDGLGWDPGHFEMVIDVPVVPLVRVT